MNDESYPVLPHHKLIAFGVARDLFVAVRAAQIRDAKLRDEATRAAKGAGRVTRPDKARAFTIARGEAVEAAAAVEIAALCGDVSQASALAVAPRRSSGRVAHRLHPTLSAAWIAVLLAVAMGAIVFVGWRWLGVGRAFDPNEVYMPERPDGGKPGTSSP
jgi:hypothetical protein